MNSESRSIRWAFWGLILLGAFTISGLFLLQLLRIRVAPLPVYGQLTDFKLTNQLGHAVSMADLTGEVWVADIIFTRCPGPCLQMTKKMKALQAAMPKDWDVKLVSLTADPQFDTANVLKTYAERFATNSSNWYFLTGPKLEIYALATQGLKLAVQENTSSTPEDEQFIHSTRFVLVDREGRLRGVSFDGTETETVPELLRAIRQLLRQG